MNDSQSNIALSQVQSGYLTTMQKFGTWNGSTTQASLVNRYGVPVNSARAVNIYRTDWQGQQLLYPTARTNSLPYSTNLLVGSPYWNTGGVTLSSAQTAPDGTLTAITLTEDTSTGSHLLSPNSFTPQTFGVNNPVYFSIAVKTITGTRSFQLVVKFSDGTTFPVNGLVFNLQTQTWTTAGGNPVVSFDTISMMPDGAGGYLCRCRTLCSISTMYLDAIYLQMSDGAAVSYTGDGTSALQFAAPQLSLTPGSYIPNDTASPLSLTDYILDGTRVTLGLPPGSTAITQATFYGT